MKAAVYHFTDKSTKRPKIYRDQLKSLTDFAASIGFEDVDIYCDRSLRRAERTEFDRFLTFSDRYDALITKDFYHISVNTGKCVSLLQQFKRDGIRVYTMENGEFTWADPAFDKPLKVASYCCRLGPCSELKHTIAIQTEILNLFVNKKTKWTIVDQFADDSLQIRGDQQIQLNDLVNNKEKYDLLLVHNISSFHYRTARMCKLREKLKLDIYSLQEGFLEYKSPLIEY